MNQPHAPAAVSVDVEDWFHVENLKGVIAREIWGRQELRKCVYLWRKPAA